MRSLLTVVCKVSIRDVCDEQNTLRRSTTHELTPLLHADCVCFTVVYRVFMMFQSYRHVLSVFFVFFVTLTCFPAIWAGVERSSCDFFIPGELLC